jgi:hypothetical protein
MFKGFIKKVGVITLATECILGGILILMTTFGDDGQPLLPSNPISLSIVDFSLYLCIFVGILSYLYCAVITAVRAKLIIWETFIPAIIGIPCLLWGGGRVLHYVGVYPFLIITAFAIAISYMFGQRDFIITNKYIPIILIALFVSFSFVDKLAAFCYFIAIIWVTVPIVAQFRGRSITAV